MPEATVIGSGVSGMSSALNLQLAGFDVHIITRDLPQFTTSMAAGAIWHGGKSSGKPRHWARVTLEHFLSLTERANSGVSLQRLREVFPHPVPDPWFRDQIPFFERIPQQNLPQDFQAGFVMDVPIVETPLYLQNLQDQFVAAGGGIETREVGTLQELAGDHRLVVNCSGVWARQVAGDAAVYPIRGQTLLIDAPEIRIGYMDDNEVTYLFPRGDGLLIGGIRTAHDWNLEIDQQLSADIIRRCSQIEPGLAHAKVLREFVGLRPGRRQVRLEAESLSGKCIVIHNYGHAAIGYTLSWGCAKDVLALAENLLRNIEDL